MSTGGGVDEQALALQTGAMIRAARERSGLSMRALAKLADISQPFLSQLERGQSMPSMITMYRLAGALDVSPGDLLPGATDGRVKVVRADEGKRLAVADRPDAAIGRIVYLAPDDQLQITDYDIGAGEYIGEWFESPGTLALFVIDGELDIVVEGAGTYRIGAGDLITHPAALRHRWLLVDDQPAHVLLVMSQS